MSESGSPMQPGLGTPPSKTGPRPLPEMDSTAVYLKLALQNNRGIWQLLNISLNLCTGENKSPFGAGTVCLCSFSTSTLIFCCCKHCLLVVACASFGTDGLVLGGSVRSKELDVMIHMGPFQTEVFNTSTALIHRLQKMHSHENSTQNVQWMGWTLGLCELLHALGKHHAFQNSWLCQRQAMKPNLLPQASRKTLQGTQKEKYFAMHCTAIGKYLTGRSPGCISGEKKKKKK